MLDKLVLAGDPLRRVGGAPGQLGGPRAEGAAADDGVVARGQGGEVEADALRGVVVVGADEEEVALAVGHVGAGPPHVVGDHEEDGATGVLGPEGENETRTSDSFKKSHW